MGVGGVRGLVGSGLGPSRRGVDTLPAGGVALLDGGGLVVDVPAVDLEHDRRVLGLSRPRAPRAQSRRASTSSSSSRGSSSAWQLVDRDGLDPRTDPHAFATHRVRAHVTRQPTSRPLVRLDSVVLDLVDFGSIGSDRGKGGRLNAF